MSEKYFNKIKYYLISIVIILEISHLSWEYMNGGVLSHYLLNRSDYPSISNWWGIIILPLLAWFSTSRIKKRMTFQPGGNLTATKIPTEILIGFFGMLMISSLQSLAFTTGYQNITMYMALGALFMGLFLPIYRAECILGHVLGAAFIFGPVIPFISVFVMAPVSALSHLWLKPLIQRIIARKPTSA